MRHTRIGLVVLLLQLLLLCAVGCKASAEAAEIDPKDVLKQAFSIVKVVGDAAVRVKGYAALKKYAPEAIPLIDVNDDKVVTLQEVEAAGQMLLAQPELVAGLLAAAYMLRKG